MTTLEAFLRTGHLGPIILGMSPTDVMNLVGDPQATSKKSNPLQLKYGCIELAFWKAPSQRVHRLREIVINFQPIWEAPPRVLAFGDWNPSKPPTERNFRSFLTMIGCSPVNLAEGPNGTRILFLSGVVALAINGMLHSIRLVQRENKEPHSLGLSTDREPTAEQILAMLQEADSAIQSGAYRAGLLMAWAGLEATLRRIARRKVPHIKTRVQPSILIRHLFAAGQLTQDEHRELEELRQLRTEVAHGLSPRAFGRDSIAKIGRLAERLLYSSRLD